MSKSFKPIIASVGTAFAIGASMPAVSASDNPFASVELASGYETTITQEGKCGGDKKEEKSEKSMKEGKCGEGKCGEGMMSEKAEDAKAKTEEAKDKADEKAEEGKCGEGKCGEGKCGGAA
ncbi:MAG: hypothetical protein ACQEQ8_10975 [Pseudomonadota bacterium]